MKCESKNDSANLLLSKSTEGMSAVEVDIAEYESLNKKRKTSGAKDDSWVRGLTRCVISRVRMTMWQGVLSRGLGMVFRYVGVLVMLEGHL